MISNEGIKSESFKLDTGPGDECSLELEGGCWPKGDPLTQILVAAGQHHTDLMEPEGFQIYNQITTLELCACYANDFYPT
ncbi:uncharacterized protein LOC106145044 isoform X6 [Ictidomys tridecemlineatus]|uniref:uncharacterized protein LOC106145044 isoform X4 n=1 Tax=Ictidomys tridecemlineatus TaxID=43179 RepID=UPI001A9E8C91|nr:uncharacterized protein LOC106145044 isoform X4 [Ictidomys tridecemlineatus]